MGVLSNLQPKLLWKWFDIICSIPHPSFKEQALAKYIIDWAKGKNLFVEEDSAGNILIRKPATIGYENKPSIAFQAHLDMVCQVNSNIEFDFDTQPILPVIKGDYVYATETTLGADNGIGLASILALLDSEDLQHPVIEGILTLSEEVGMGGALGLKSNWFTSEYMINTDTEEWGDIYIGCAGGSDAELKENFTWYNKNGLSSISFNISGYRGGHSGVEIHKNLENAIHVAFEILAKLQQKIPVYLKSIKAGTARNAIPREIEIVLSVDQENTDKALTILNKDSESITNIYKTAETNGKYESKLIIDNSKHLSLDDSNKIINFINALPNGVQRWSDIVENTVETSLSLGIIKLQPEKELKLCILLRSIIDDGNALVKTKLTAIAQAFGFNFSFKGDYPAWQPELNGFYYYVKDIYEKEVNGEVGSKVIHAGLECGIVKGHYPNLKILSVGPNIYSPHSPTECVQISSVEKYWDLIVSILKNIPDSLEK